MRVRHLRRGPVPEEVGLATRREWRLAGYEPLPKGGLTEVRLHRDGDPEANLVAMGVARCSDHDNYNRRIGRDIALGRALKELR